MKLIKEYKNLFGQQFFSYVDIGARVSNAKIASGLEDQLIYHVFEPDEVECKRLENLSSNQKGSYHYYPVALSNEMGFKNFYITQDPFCSSLYRPNKKICKEYNMSEKLAVQSKTKIKTETLDNWQKSNNIDGVDFIKIDVQGAELDVLEGGKKLLKSVIGVFSEVEFRTFYEGQPLFHSLNSFLIKNGFSIINIEKVKAKKNVLVLNSGVLVSLCGEMYFTLKISNYFFVKLQMTRKF